MSAGNSFGTTGSVVNASKHQCCIRRQVTALQIGKQAALYFSRLDFIGNFPQALKAFP